MRLKPWEVLDVVRTGRVRVRRTRRYRASSRYFDTHAAALQFAAHITDQRRQKTAVLRFVAETFHGIPPVPKPRGTQSDYALAGPKGVE